ncbi:MAG: RHS repeat-associated core domain-containing protein [Armatimonadota bacterium]
MVNPYKYVGQLGCYSDAGTGLMLLGYRFYDPVAGVFTQPDSSRLRLTYHHL